MPLHHSARSTVQIGGEVGGDGGNVLHPGLEVWSVSGAPAGCTTTAAPGSLLPLLELTMTTYVTGYQADNDAR